MISRLMFPWHAMRSVLAILALCTYAASAHAQSDALNFNAQGAFLDGYDVVAYFKRNEAVPGSPKLAIEYRGGRFQFANAKNLATFKADPRRYMPKYGGFCAFGMANGKAGVPANPKTFKLYNGELLVFYDGPYEGKRFNTSVPWNADERSLYQKAEAHWKALGN